MADTTSIQTYDGIRNVQVKVIDVSDGTGLTNFTVLTGSSLTPASTGGHMKIKRIRYSIFMQTVTLKWDGVTPAIIAFMSQGEDILDFSATYAGGFPNNATTPNGNVILTTDGATVSSGFTLELEFIKGL